MRTSGDAPRLARFADGNGPREPGSDVEFPDCGCDAEVLLDADAVRYLTADELAAVVDEKKAACLHRCPGWPDRRREPGGVVRCR